MLLLFLGKDEIIMVYKDSERKHIFCICLSGNYLPAYHFHPLFQKYLHNQLLFNVFAIAATAASNCGVT